MKIKNRIEKTKHFVPFILLSMVVFYEANRDIEDHHQYVYSYIQLIKTKNWIIKSFEKYIFLNHLYFVIHSYSIILTMKDSSDNHHQCYPCTRKKFNHLIITWRSIKSSLIIKSLLYSINLRYNVRTISLVYGRRNSIIVINKINE